MKNLFLFYSFRPLPSIQRLNTKIFSSSLLQSSSRERFCSASAINCAHSSLILSRNQFNIQITRFKSSTNRSDEESQRQPPESPTTIKPSKKPSKFKQFYSQYGPIFIMIHLTTVVLWIWGFFMLSKQGYDITQLLNVLHKINVMSEETVQRIHEKISNYKTESGWITGNDIKHFATAYMIYKVIAPFRYMVSIAIVRKVVNVLRSKKILK